MSYPALACDLRHTFEKQWFGRDDLRVSFDSRVKLKFLGSKVTTDAGLLAYRELDETLGLTEMGTDELTDLRLGSNKQHQLVPLLRQSIYSRLAGYEDVNDAERLAIDPIDARKPAGYTTSEAKSRTAVTKCLEDHRNFDSARAGC
jgi:DDE family transposase